MAIEKKDKMTVLNFCVIVCKKDLKIRFIKTNFFILDRNVYETLINQIKERI